MSSGAVSSNRLLLLFVSLLAMIYSSSLLSVWASSVDGTCYNVLPHIDGLTTRLIRTSHTPATGPTTYYATYSILIKNGSATEASLYPSATNGWASNGSSEIIELKSQVVTTTNNDIVCVNYHSYVPHTATLQMLE
jgi:hypothetical protein